MILNSVSSLLAIETFENIQVYSENLTCENLETQHKTGTS